MSVEEVGEIVGGDIGSVTTYFTFVVASFVVSLHMDTFHMYYTILFI